MLCGARCGESATRAGDDESCSRLLLVWQAAQLLRRRWLLDGELAAGQPPVPAAQQAHRRGDQHRQRHPQTRLPHDDDAREDERSSAALMMTSPASFPVRAPPHPVLVIRDYRQQTPRMAGMIRAA
jgi:hypothetical protein